MKSIVSEKGQITIPKRLRDSLGLKHGTVLIFHEKQGQLVGMKQEAVGSISSWRGKGKIPRGLSTDSYLKQTRGT